MGRGWGEGQRMGILEGEGGERKGWRRVGRGEGREAGREQSRVVVVFVIW